MFVCKFFARLFRRFRKSSSCLPTTVPQDLTTTFVETISPHLHREMFLQELKREVVLRQMHRNFIKNRNVLDNHHERCLQQIQTRALEMKEKRTRQIFDELCKSSLFDGFLSMQRKMNHPLKMKLLHELQNEVEWRRQIRARKELCLKDVKEIGYAKTTQRSLLHRALTVELPQALKERAQRMQCRAAKVLVLCELLRKVEERELFSYRLNIFPQREKLMKQLVEKLSNPKFSSPSFSKFFSRPTSYHPLADEPLVYLLLLNLFVWAIAFAQIFFLCRFVFFFGSDVFCSFGSMFSMKKKPIYQNRAARRQIILMQRKLDKKMARKMMMKL